MSSTVAFMSRNCMSPASSHSSSGCSQTSDSSSSRHIKLKRRWIEMNSVDEDLDSGAQSKNLHFSKPRDEQNSVAVKQPRVVLPQDPRNWSKRDVVKWLKYMMSTYDIELEADKFDMNGKALCLMSMDMFIKRVPTGGKFLYRDFRLRLYPAVFFEKYSTPDYSKMTPLELLTVTTGKYIT